MTYYLAPALDELRDNANERYPKRDKSSDGWIGDTSHSARKSDHNPDWNAGGVVRALDIDIDDNDAKNDLVADVLKAAIGDPRVWYVIYNRKIYSRTHGWKARRYTGANPHTKHVHVSLRHSRAAENDRKRWFGPIKAAAPVKHVLAPEINLTLLRAQFDAALNGGKRFGQKEVFKNSSTIRLQHALNRRWKAGLKVDGILGPATIRAWGAHCKDPRVNRRGEVLGMPDRGALSRLVGSWYRITG